jgi:hypothetical protein
VLNCRSFLVTEAQRKHVRRRANLVAVACFFSGLAEDLSAPRYIQSGPRKSSPGP